RTTRSRSKAAHPATFFQFSDLAAAPRWCIAMIWSWGVLNRSHVVSRDGNVGQNARFVWRTEAAAYSPVLAAPPRKEDPGQKGQGLIAGWVRGWGLGGTPPGAVGSTPRSRPGFLCAKLFSAPSAPRASAALRARPMRDIGWEFDLPAVGKLEISQMDAKDPLGAAMALDYISCADREPVRETLCEGNDNFLMPMKRVRWELAATNAGLPRQFRDIRAPTADFCESL